MLIINSFSIMQVCKRVFFLFLSVSLCCCKTVKEANELVVATWNIGYFSNGISSRSSIKVDEYEKKLAEYRSFIYNEIHPDIISINEYNLAFTDKNVKDRYNTSSVLFNDFHTQLIGPSKGIRKALFSNVKLEKDSMIYLNSRNNLGLDDADLKDGYFVASDFRLGGKTVKFVSVHLMFSRKYPSVVQQNQIDELIKRYDEYDYVVMCGDWNTSDYSKFKKAGYTMANDGSLVTFPSRKTPLDNIIAKGVKISDVRVLKTELSDHYPIVCKISLIDE